MGSSSLPSLSIEGLTIQDEVGRGANSRVFRASRGVDTVAVKVPRDISRDFDDPAIRQFQREGSILACLTHPVLPHVFEVGVSEGLPYIVLEYIEGDSLDEQLASGPLPTDRLLEYGEALSGVLAALHDRGLIHCDVTPQNILIDPDGNPRLIDFGLADGWGAEPSGHDDGPVGTVRYASPEQTGMLDRPVDGRSDLYELGAVLFHCATGHPPYQGDSATDIKRRHATAPVPDPREGPGQLPERLARLVEQLLAKEPTDRPANARNVLTEFHRCHTDEVATSEQFLQIATRTSSATDHQFSGRRQKLRRFRSLWEEVQKDGSRAAMLVGSAGSGKTALIDTLLDELADERGLVLQVEGLVEEPYPHAPIRRMFAPLTEYAQSLEGRDREVADRTLQDAMGEYAPVLESVFPEFADDRSRTPESPESAGSEEVYRGIASMIRSLATRAGGAILVVDDAHQLDDATLEVLERLALESDDVPLLILAVCDQGGGPESIDRLQASLESILELEEHLGPMGPEALEELIRTQLGNRPVDMRLVERITTLSHGNPYAAAAYVRAVLDGAVLRPTWNGWEIDDGALEELDLPEELSALLVERLERLSDRAMEVVVWLSVFTTSVDLETLAACIALPRAELQRAIGEAHRNRLIDIDQSGRYALVHDEIRRGAIERLDDDELRDHHQRAADVLDDGSDHPDRLYQMAHHYGRGCIDDNHRRAFELNAKASRLARDRLAYERAFEFARRAWEIAETYSLAPDAEFHAAVGDLAVRTSRLGIAQRHLEYALESSDEPWQRAELYCQLANTYLSSYDAPAARGAIVEAFAQVDEPFPRPSATNLTKTIAQWVAGEWTTSFGTTARPRGDDRSRRVLFSLYQVAQRVAYFTTEQALLAQAGVRALRLAQKLGEPTRLAQAHASHAVFLTVAGLHSRVPRHMELAREFAESADDPFVAGQVTMYDSLTSAFRGDPERADRIMREVFAEPVMLESFEHLSGLNVRILHFNYRGHFRRAVTDTERTRKQLEARFGEESPHLAVIYSNLTLPSTILGLEQRAERFERLADKYRPGTDEPFRLADYYSAKLGTRIQRGQWGDETERIVDKFQAIDTPPSNLRFYNRFFFVHLCFLRLHQLEHDVLGFDEGMRRLDRALELLEDVAGTAVYDAYLLLFRAARARLDDRLGEARSLLARAQRAADRYYLPVISFEVARHRALLKHEAESPAARDRYLRLAVDIASEHGWETYLTRLQRQFTGLLDGTPSRATLGSSVSGTGSTTLTTSWADEQLSSLEQMDSLITEYAETERQFEEILTELLELFGAERARLYAIDSDSGLIEEASAAIEGAEPSDDTDAIRQAAERVYRTQEPLFDHSDEGEASPALAESDARSLLAVPLRFRGRTSGILYLDSRLADGVFQAGDRDFLQLVGNHLLLLLESARARDYQQKIADAEERSAALLEHATRAVEIGVATMQPDESLARVSPTVHTIVEPWQTTAVWWERVLETIDWPDPQTCPRCGNPEYVGEVLADLRTPGDDGDGGRRRVFEITSTGHGHELTETSGEHVLLVRNITEQFETNEQLKRMNRELKKARDQAMAASEAKSKFLARMSHEFRTPLNAVLGYTELLLENVDHLEPQQMASDLEHIQTSGEQLQRLIGDVLDLTKIDSGRLQLDPVEVDIAEIVEELTTTLQPMLDESENELVVELESPEFDVRTDETKLRQLLLNLLRNAAKFTDDGTITLSVESVEPADDDENPRVAFEVADTGIGMTDEEQAEIFEPFFQADDSSTSEYRGTGLGLTLVQRFAERMGGHIEVDSTPGEGTTFRLELPAELDPGASDDEQVEPEIGAAPSKA